MHHPDTPLQNPPAKRRKDLRVADVALLTVGELDGRRALEAELEARCCEAAAAAEDLQKGTRPAAVPTRGRGRRRWQRRSAGRGLVHTAAQARRGHVIGKAEHRDRCTDTTRKKPIQG